MLGGEEKNCKRPVSAPLNPCIDLPIDEKTLLELTEKAKDWALMHGAAMRSKTKFDPDALYFAPFVLFPSPFPRKEFVRATKLQPILNELMHRVAHDEEFLRTTLAETIQVDDFTANLFALYEDVIKEGFVQDVPSLGLLRSDYLVHSFDNIIKQVEINTIASSFGGISTYMRPLQSFVLKEMGLDGYLISLPNNYALQDLCGGMIKACEMGKEGGGILFVIEDVSYNICDQRFHEYEIKKQRPKLKVIRRTLTQIYNQGLVNENKELMVDNHIINLVYFRAGYEPGHYPTKNEWEARKLIECSKAIKCPSIQYHLAGTKKVQQALATPGILKRFLKDEKKIESVKEIFTGLYSLDNNEAGNKAYKMALTEPEKYVLKPQREGGGNNIYGLDIPPALKKMSTVERSSWILMDRIHPPITKGYMIRPGGPMPPPIAEMVSELGIFGVVIGNPSYIYENYQAGHMLRTKLATANEGGVAAGLGALDSPYLVD